MLTSLSRTSDLTLTQRLLAIAALTALTAIGARITIPLEPVPFTFQVLAVLLAGMLLGARDGALSQLAYVGLIALNLPLDARALGAAALVGPTAGYIYGFVLMAFVAGWLVEHGAQRAWQRWLAGVGRGCRSLSLRCCWPDGQHRNGPINAAWTAGVAPFIAFDLVKAALAVSLLVRGSSPDPARLSRTYNFSRSSSVSVRPRML